MSNDPNQEASTPNNAPPPQENYGPPFPEEPAAAQPVLPAYAMPSTYINMPAQTTQNLPPRPTSSPPPLYGYGFPPPGGYGAPPVGPGIQPTVPLPLGEAVRQLPRQYWRVLSKPSAATFAAEQGKAAWNIIWVQLLGMGVLTGLVILLTYTGLWFLFQSLLLSTMRSISTSSSSPDFMNTFAMVYWIEAFVFAFLAIILVPAFFFMGTGINYLIGKAFGGTGSFLAYCYGSVLITTPIGFLTTILSIIPFIGSFAALAGSIYQIVLLIHMTMAVHRLSGGKASATILIPAITSYVIVFSLLIAYFIFIFSLVSQVH